MEWLGFIAMAVLLHASVTPLMLFAGLVIVGIGSVEQLLVNLALVLFVFGSTFLIVEWFLRALGGEMDPPASRGYRRRP